MGRLAWIETLDGWIGGRYQIELAAPQLWVLSRRGKDAAGSGPIPAALMHTGGSLQELKRLAEELERRRRHRIRLGIHLGVFFGLIAATAFEWASGWSLAATATFAIAFIAFLRTVVAWIDHVTGNAWSMVSKSYQ